MNKIKIKTNFNKKLKSFPEKKTENFVWVFFSMQKEIFNTLCGNAGFGNVLLVEKKNFPYFHHLFHIFCIINENEWLSYVSLNN